MDKMSVFSDVVNESFNYSEIEWGGNSYLVDFHNRESLVKLIKAVTGETDLNEGIKKLPDELLEQTSYSKFQEESGNRNWVLYNKKQYTVIDCHDYYYNRDIKVIRYIGKSSQPFQPFNISTMDFLFYRCGLHSLDLTRWDTSKIVSMQKTFFDCRWLISLNIASWDVHNVTVMASIFGNCQQLVFLDVADWNVAKVQNMFATFSNAFSLTLLNLTKWDTSNVIDMRSMFCNCRSLTEIDLSSWKKRGKAIEKTFKNCKSLKTTHNPEFNRILAETR